MESYQNTFPAFVYLHMPLLYTYFHLDNDTRTTVPVKQP